MRKIIFLMNTYLKYVLQSLLLFFSGPNYCLICGNNCGIIEICKNCRNIYFSEAYIYRNKRCNSCGKELIGTKNNCMECRVQVVAPHSDSIFSIFPYRLWNKELMYLWKSLNLRTYSLFYSQILSSVLNHFNYRIIVPVPPRPGKIKEKGWDQIDEICSLLKYKYNFKVLSILERKSMGQQKKLNKNNRLMNIGSGYTNSSIKKINRELKRNKMVLPEEVCLIDDVCTTGATIETCCKLIKNLGIKKVNVITLFKVD